MLLTVSNNVSVADLGFPGFGVRGCVVGVVGVAWLPGCRARQGGEKKKPPGNNKSDVSVNRKKGGMCV